MRQAIWKFELEVKEEQTIAAPPFIPLTVQVQNNHPCLWAIVDVDATPVSTPIIMRGTGWTEDSEKVDMAVKLRYLGTVQINGFVRHYFW